MKKEELPIADRRLQIADRLSNLRFAIGNLQ